ncbi:hypothetical protein HPB50_000850 [Hyalomma asiaticum]|uniref:Uncharacterized protein n=1 Tax=Hyalomma asiaticum TaxID=266040 RepID=A0ACB7RXL0_HYAAI|nr:hypothetical protein HPB50_000850 [Hyalomma asiaticum]
MLTIHEGVVLGRPGPQGSGLGPLVLPPYFGTLQGIPEQLVLFLRVIAGKEREIFGEEIGKASVDDDDDDADYNEKEVQAAGRVHSAEGEARADLVMCIYTMPSRDLTRSVFGVHRGLFMRRRVYGGDPPSSEHSSAQSRVMRLTLSEGGNLGETQEKTSEEGETAQLGDACIGVRSSSRIRESAQSLGGARGITADNGAPVEQGGFIVRGRERHATDMRN